MPRKSRIYKKPLVFGLALLVLMAWGGGLSIFIDAIPKIAHQIAQPHAQPHDGIVVLTGGTGRLEMGLALLNAKHGQKLLVSGVHRALDMKEIIRVFQQSPAITQCCLDLGYVASNTAGNAKEIKDWANKAQFKNLLVVTSNYHMPRAMLEIRHQLPTLGLTAYPVFSPHVKINQWYRDISTSLLIIGEYHKMLLAYLRIKIDAGISHFVSRPVWGN